jgi:hypothetical protein
MEMLQRHQSDPPEPVSHFVRDVPGEMDALIAQLLEKDPEKRVANATLVARRLETMLKALSRPRSSPEKRIVAEAEPEFDLSVPGTDERSTPPAGQPETRLIEPELPPSAVPIGVTRPAEELPETMATEAFLIYDQAKAAGKTDRVSTGRFTVVDKEDLDRAELEQPPRPAIISLQTWILAGCLLAVGLGAWYLLRPPSADDLDEKIKATITDDKSIESLLEAESSMREFLTRYSDDPRAGKLRPYMREIELSRLERRFERRAKGTAGTEGLLPVERAYVEAINQAWLDPDRALVKLQALVDLHQDRTDPTGPDGQCLELARRQLTRLRQQLAKSSADSLVEVENRLNRAESLRGTDPEAGRTMLRALIELYHEKPWAAESVGRARRLLEARNAPGASGEGRPKSDGKNINVSIGVKK